MRRRVGRSPSDQNQSRASFEQVFWRAARNTGVILRPQTPLSYPSQKKTVQNDVTLIHSENPSEKKRCEFCFKITLMSSGVDGDERETGPVAAVLFYSFAGRVFVTSGLSSSRYHDTRDV
jgi:hypothetical protein